MMTAEDFAKVIADAVDRRRAEIGAVLRVVANEEKTVLELTASIMALPVLYAHWEGFVKEAVGQYVEFVERQSLAPAQAHPTIFSFAMKKHLKLLRDSGSVERMTTFATWIIENTMEPVRFEDKTIETGGNLSYENLEAICSTLRIDIAKLFDDKRKIDAMLFMRNNIAHTGRPPKLESLDITGRADLVMKLIQRFEGILCDCVKAEHYRTPLSA